MSITRAAMVGGELNYDVPHSGVFAEEDNSYLSRTFTSGNRRVWTFSVWVKKADVSKHRTIFAAGLTPTGYAGVRFNIDDTLLIWSNPGGPTNEMQYYTEKLFRDTSEWYHIVMALDTTQPVASDRFKLWVNNKSMTFSTAIHPALNLDAQFNRPMEHAIGADIRDGVAGSGTIANQYKAEIYFIDGQVLTPDYFAEKGPRTGQWNPKKYTGTYGTNGFYLNFQNTSELGEDASGNGNDWVNSGVTQSTDTPTDNHATLNVLDISQSTGRVIGETGLYASGPASGGTLKTDFTIMPTTGKYYCEIESMPNGGKGMAGISLDAEHHPADITKVRIGDTGDFTYGTYGIAIDLDAGKIWVQIAEGVWDSGDPELGITPFDTWTPGDVKLLRARTERTTLSANYGRGRYNFTESSWTYSAPSGFKALSSKNLPEPIVRKSGKYFKTFTYSGNGTGLQVGYDVQDIDIYPLSNSGVFANENENGSQLQHTPPSVTNRKTWTLSLWVKPSNTDGRRTLFSVGSNTNNFTEVNLTNGQVRLLNYRSGKVLDRISLTKLSDSSRYYHLVVAFDMTESAAVSRQRVYVDNMEITSWTNTTIDGQNNDTWANSTFIHTIGDFSPVSPAEFDGYMAEYNFIDGQALTANDFGQKDGNGYWVPKQYIGTYGTNGFHLDFSDEADLGKDISGNNNHYTNSGVTQSIDNPSNSFCTIDMNLPATDTTRASAGLQHIGGGSGGQSAGTTAFNIATSKFEFEATINSGSYMGIGVVPINDITAATNPASANSHWVYGNTGLAYIGNVNSGNSVSTFTTGDVIKVRIDSGDVFIFKNGVAQNSGAAIWSGLTGKWLAYCHHAATATCTFDFGQNGFTPAEGYFTLSSNNIPDEEAFVDSPDLVWIKSRTLGNSHVLFDSMRGPFKSLVSNSTTAELPDVGEGVAELNRSGFRLAAGNNSFNALNESYVAWVWNKGVIPGFDIVEYEGDGGVVRNIQHSLGAHPNVMILKSLDSANDWPVYHSSLGATEFVELNTTANAATSINRWYDTEPSDSEFTVTYGGTASTNVSGERYIAYLFSEVDGFSKFGSYTGNGSIDGPFVYCGFRPALIMIKRAGGIGAWVMIDATRDAYNEANAKLQANDSSAEFTTTGDPLDILSNGFKNKGVGADSNVNGSEYIFIAFAESPFKYSRAR